MTRNNQILLPQISHDLRNYINGISGLVGIISQNINNYLAEQKRRGISLDINLQEIHECANMLSPYSIEAMRYVDDLLNNSQLKSDEFTLGKLEDCNVGALAKEMSVFNQTFAKEHQVTIRSCVEEDLPTFRTDILRLKQILINLTTNAVKYSEIGSIVDIDCKSFSAPNQDDKKYIKITISDFGIGMSEEEIAMALNGQGQQIDKAILNKEIDSHGLGMPIVKQLVQLLDIEMEIESQKGLGTKVILSLPCVN